MLMAVSSKTCGYAQCQKSDDVEPKICMGCRLVYFCDKTCQSLAWKAHQVACKQITICNDEDELVEKIKESLRGPVFKTTHFQVRYKSQQPDDSQVSRFYVIHNPQGQIFKVGSMSIKHASVLAPQEKAFADELGRRIRKECNIKCWLAGSRGGRLPSI